MAAEGEPMVRVGRVADDRIWALRLVLWGRALWLPLLATLLIASSGWGSGTSTPTETATAEPIATRAPIAVASEPAANFQLSDPSFAPLEHARAIYGRLGGSVYRMEVPDNWNGKLVMYFHGQAGLYNPMLRVENPPNRRELIVAGYAWAASSFSRQSILFKDAADETAALYNEFTQSVGKPARTYLEGGSAGGASELISASRYDDRYDGVLALCPVPGTTPDLEYLGDTVVAALYAAGLSQSEYDPATIRDVMARSVIPRLKDDPEAQRRFVDIWIQLSGGPRSYAEAGLSESLGAAAAVGSAQDYLLTFGAKIVSIGSYDNVATVYALGLASVSDADFNQHVVRVSSPGQPKIGQGDDDVSGDIKMPVFALYSSGDPIIPPVEARFTHDTVAAAGRSDLLVQRTANAVGHCRQSITTIQSAFDELVNWVENGVRPSP